MITGSAKIGMMLAKIADHPTRVQMIIVPPISAKGKILPVYIQCNFCSIELKSLESKLIIFPVYEVLITNEDSLETR